jgi:hypothetical protein
MNLTDRLTRKLEILNPVRAREEISVTDVNKSVPICSDLAGEICPPPLLIDSDAIDFLNVSEALKKGEIIPCGHEIFSDICHTERTNEKTDPFINANPFLKLVRAWGLWSALESVKCVPKQSTLRRTYDEYIQSRLAESQSDSLPF